MSDLLQFLATGISVGVAVGLVSVGFILVHRVTGIVNLAQGTFVALGGLAAAAAAHGVHPGPPGVLLASVAAVLPWALAVAAAALFAQRSGGDMIALLATIGLSLLFEGLALLAFGSNPLSFPSPAGSHAFFLGGAAILPQQVLTVAAGALILVASQWFLEHTAVGTALRACAVNADAARLFGISARAMGILSFALAGILGALAGFLVAPLTPVDFGADIGWTLNGFSAAVLGGLDDPLRAMGGGLALGLVESFLGGYVSPAYETAAALALMLLVLLWRPQGLFGSRGAA